MADFDTVKGFLLELQLSVIREDPPEGLVVVEDEERGIKNLVVAGSQGTPHSVWVFLFVLSDSSYYRQHP